MCSHWIIHTHTHIHTDWIMLLLMVRERKIAQEKKPICRNRRRKKNNKLKNDQNDFKLKMNTKLRWNKTVQMYSVILFVYFVRRHRPIDASLHFKRKSYKIRSFVTRYVSCDKFSSWFVHFPCFSHSHTNETYTDCSLPFVLSHSRTHFVSVFHSVQAKAATALQRQTFIHSQLNIYAAYALRMNVPCDRISEKSNEQTVLHVSVQWIVVFQFFYQKRIFQSLVFFPIASQYSKACIEFVSLHIFYCKEKIFFK